MIPRPRGELAYPPQDLVDSDQCELHASGIRRALEQPGTYHVSWGRLKAEQIARLRPSYRRPRAEVAAATAALEAYVPPRDDPFGAPAPRCAVHPGHPHRPAKCQ